MKRLLMLTGLAAAAIAMTSVEARAGSCKSCGTHGKAEKKVGAAEAKAVDTVELKKLIESDKGAVVLDARTGKWDDGERIPGASALSPKASSEEITKSIGSKDTLVVTYCSNLKCGASASLAKRLRKLGYSNVVEYPEGIAGWKAAGNKVEK